MGVSRPAGSSRMRKLTPSQKAVRRRNKPVFDGHRSERGIEQIIVDSGVDAWRYPGQRSKSISTPSKYVPDMAAWFPRMDGYGVRAMPNDLKSERREANVIFEIKSQKVSGSVDKKIMATIDDLAYAADSSRAVPVMVLDTPVFKPEMIEMIRSWAKVSLVVVMTKDELAMKSGRRKLRAEVVRVAKDRVRLRRKLYAATGELKPFARLDTGTHAAMVLQAYASRQLRGMARS